MGISRKKTWSRAAGLLLSLILLLIPAAQALTVEQARELLSEYYVDEIPEQVLNQATIEDIILALGDPYTQYMTAEEYSAFAASMKDEVVVGIGVSLMADEAGLRVAGVFSGSAAAEAGLEAGDIITAVDGKSAAGVDTELVASWVRGAEDTQVTVTVLHTDGSEGNYTLTRKPVVIPATTSEEVNGHICYIVCDTFGSETLGHFQEAMDTYAEKTDHWIVDLRGNPGGDVDAAVNTLGIFLGQGDMVYFRDSAGDYYRYVSQSDSGTLYPMIVLTSPWTASASEIFSGAVRDREAGLIVGSRTYGKGVAQILLDENAMPDYFSDGSALKITTYRYFSPSGNTADAIGVIPHLLVPYQDAAAVSYLLCATIPSSQNKDILRIHLGSWRWYLNLDEAAREEQLPVMRELLEALPPQAELFRGTGGTDWSETTAAEVAASMGVELIPRTFTDAAGSEYETEINTLKTYEIVKGCDDGLYHPESSLTRAELCALLAQVMNLKLPDGTSVFSDVPEGAWYKPYVNALYRMGLVEGSGDGLFHPEDILDHEQFITVMARLSARLKIDFYELAKTGPGDEVLADASLAAYSDWARDSVWLLSKSQTNILGGEVNLLFAPVDQLEPNGATLRGEAAALVYSILTYTGILAF